MLAFSSASFGQSALFAESNYTLEAQGEDSTGSFVKTFRHNSSTNYRMKKIYADSSYTALSSKGFYKDSLREGPFTVYYKGVVGLQGSYKNGKWDGERLTYMNTVLTQKAYYSEGVKTGIWEEYSPAGALKRKLTYNNGNLVSDVRY